MDAAAYLTRLMPTREEVGRFLSREPSDDPVAGNKGWTYDAGLGWVLRNSARDDGVDGSRTFYRYEDGGCRQRVNFPDGPCRVHAYGDSFTHCDQVSDGETWEEFLAAHLREPVMNFGVGGYGVYQAYLRMMRQEERDPAEYVILNIWDDDHYRNLDAWRSIRFGFRTPCGFTLPHIEVDLEKGICEPKGNPCASPQDVSRLTDRKWVLEAFADDPVLGVVLGTMRDDAAGTPARPVEVSFGLPLSKTGDAAVAELRRRHTEAALMATKKVLEWTQEAAKERGQRLLLILSHGQEGIRRDLAGEPRWDGSFLEWLKGRDLPVLDLRDAHREEFAALKMPAGDYLKRYYIGHYSPAGNFFFASSIRRHVAEWLFPPPKPYASRRS